MIWNSEGYWQKAKAYNVLAQNDGREAWEKSFWRALSLELLLRAALTKIHPALNADPQSEGQHIMYAFGFPQKGEPRSIPVQAVTARLERILSNFQKPHRDFCDFLMMKRNEECHTCESPFSAMAESKWLPQFYDVCQILNEHLGKEDATFFGEAEASTASQLIEARKTKKQGDVKRLITSHAVVFMEKPEEERQKLKENQETAPYFWPGNTNGSVECPACHCVARLEGGLERESDPIYDDGTFYVHRTYLAKSLTCGACGLSLRDIEELHVAEIEPHFSLKEPTDLHEFYEPEDVDEYMNM